MAEIAKFGAATAALLLLPGPSNTLLATAGATIGIRRSLILIVCEIISYLAAISILLVLGHVLLQTSPYLLKALKVALVVFILLTAWRAWRSTFKGYSRDGFVVTPATLTLATLLNPKSMIFAFLIFPPVMNTSDALRFGGAFGAIASVIALGWIVLGAAAGSFIPAGQVRLIPRASAVILFVFACVAAASI